MCCHAPCNTMYSTNLSLCCCWEYMLMHHPAVTEGCACVALEARALQPTAVQQ
jgi:hypothetical protein